MALANTIFAFYSPMLILIRRERVVKRSAVRRGPGDNANFLLADTSSCKEGMWTLNTRLRFELALDVPYRMVLGVFTFIVLCRDRVARLFARAR
jgi:hypothetical protein